MPSHRHPAAGVSGVEQSLQRPVERRVAGIGPERGHDDGEGGSRGRYSTRGLLLVVVLLLAVRVWGLRGEGEGDEGMQGQRCSFCS